MAPLYDSRVCTVAAGSRSSTRLKFRDGSVRVRAARLTGADGLFDEHSSYLHTYFRLVHGRRLCRARAANAARREHKTGETKARGRPGLGAGQPSSRAGPRDPHWRQLGLFLGSADEPREFLRPGSEARSGARAIWARDQADARPAQRRESRKPMGRSGAAERRPRDAHGRPAARQCASRQRLSRDASAKTDAQKAALATANNTPAWSNNRGC